MFFCLGNIQVGAQSIDSSDAIAIRVIPNPGHLSAIDWYNKNNFTGSPQSLIVDGYEAVRDGRTVYANVANVSMGNLYTNIYLISYNQEAQAATVDVFGEILKHWKFNVNVSDYGICVNKALDSGIKNVCILDSDCPAGDFCDSNKARLARDVRRLADLSKISILLEDYKNRGFYPKLNSGSYLPNRTMSVWPSWQDNLSKEIGGKLPFDPINELGDCDPASGYAAGFNEASCWSEDRKEYAEEFPGLPGDRPKMPDNSTAYAYQAESAGGASQVCAVFESGLIIVGDVFCSLPVCIDRDGDGYGIYDSGNPGLCEKVGADCDDTDSSIGGGGVEFCDNGVDDDCDGWIDCDDPSCVDDENCISPDCDLACNGVCSDPLCGIDKDPDCHCVDDDGCCGVGCDISADNDCPSECIPDGCNGNCPPGCNYPHDFDCACVDNDGCCGEGCDISVDNDCPPACEDNDGDGYFAFDPAWCPSGDDCDDSAATGHLRNPGLPDICDGIDNDCNSMTADGSDEVPPLNSKQAGICGGSENSCIDGSWTDDYSGIFQYEDPEISCSDGIDNDCDGQTDGADPDCSGTCFGASSGEHFWYIASEDPDCNQCDFEGSQDGDQPGDWSPFPGMADICDSDCGIVSATVDRLDYEHMIEVSCDDGIDNDCDGKIDCLDNDCALAPNCCIDTCSAPNEPNCWVSAPENSEAGTGICCDPAASCYVCQDAYAWDGNNCALTGECYRDSDNDGFGDPLDSVAAAGICPSGYVPNNQDCDDAEYWVNPGAEETCDTLDNNCEGNIDEGCDDDGDGYCDDSIKMYNNNSMCVNTVFTAEGQFGDDCDDADFWVNSGVAENTEELCSDGIDNDCDGLVDCEDPDCAAAAACSGSGLCIFNFTFPCAFP